MKTEHPDYKAIKGIDKTIKSIEEEIELEKFPAYEKWLMRECKGNEDAMFFLLHGELYKGNEIVFDWLEEIDLIKMSSIIIKRNK